MPLVKGTSAESCISQNYKKEIKTGKEPKVAKAIALSHCSKFYSSIKKAKKDSKNELELIFLNVDLELEQEELNQIQKELEKAKKQLQND